MRNAIFTLAASLLVFSCSSSDSSTTSPTKGDAGTTSRTTPSFKDDVIPVFAASCALTACHASKQSNLGIFISNDAAQVYAELQKKSPTTGMAFVVAGDPDKSYLMLKMDGKEASATCPASGCGTEMPPGAVLAADQRDIVRKWITAGAKDD